MSKRAKKRTFKVGDKVMLIGTVKYHDGGAGEYQIGINGDEVYRWFSWQALHPHTVRATPEARPKVAKKKARTK